MKKTTGFDYYYGQEAEQFSFFRIPRILVKDDRFAGLSSDAKLLYGLLLDRMALSQRNGWIDEGNRVYIIYTIQEIREDLGCGKEKAVKMMAELDTAKGIGLVERRRRGLGQPDILYEELHHGRRTCKPGWNPRGREIGLQEVGKADFKKSENRPQEVGKSDFKKSENRNAGGRKNRPAEVGISESNYTDSNHTERSKTQSIHQSAHPPREAANINSEMDAMDVNATLSLIKRNIEYDHHMTHDSDDERRRYDELYQVIVDTVFGKTDAARIGESVFPYEVVRARMLKLTAAHLEYVRASIAENDGEVRNMKKYMLAALYNAPATMDTYYTQMVRHDMYGGGWRDAGVI